MKKKTTFILVLVIIIILFLIVPNYAFKNTDYAWYGQECGFHFNNLPHNNKSCVPPFTCRNIMPDAGGTCSF